MLAVNSLSAQENIISGSVIDLSDKQAIPYPVILIKGTNTSTTADDNGHFKLPVKALPVTLVVYQFGYYTKEITVNTDSRVVIELKSKAINLSEVTVVSKRVDTIQKKSNSVYLAFEFYDNFIVALVSKGNLFNYIQLIDDNGNIVKEKKAPEGVESLFVDCFGNVQLVSKEYSYQFFYDYVNIIFMDKVPAVDFYSRLVPCQCVFGNYVYFKEVYHRQLKNRYFYISRNKTTDRKIITELSDQDKVTKFNNDYNINYFLGERRKGFGYATSVDELTAKLDELRENVPLSSDYLFMMQPVRSELIKRDSCLLIVDYTNKLISKYSFLGGLLRKDSLTLSGLTPAAVIDKDKNRYYFVSETNGTTTLHYPKKNNEYSKIIIEDFKFIKNLRSRNGIFYFLYRDPKDNARMKIHAYRA